MENKKIVDYIIITFESKELVQLKVLEKIKEGYTLLGGISMAIDSGELRSYNNFAQAMIKYSDK